MIKTTVAVIVYNRLNNLKLWLECWHKCDQSESELVIIHNVDRTIRNKIEYKELCIENGVRYIERENIGLDIGAFRDFIGMCDTEFILWITDDTIPMQKDFVSKYTEKINHNTGLVVTEISNINSPLHVRTTGFLIKIELALRLVFPNPLTTKEHCYFFEHRGGRNTLMQQVISMGSNVAKVTEKPELAPLWDTHNRAKFNRSAEHKKAFEEEKMEHVTIICPIFNSYPQIISSMICQTHQDWELLLVHDGPNSTGLKNIVDNYNDSRIKYIESKEHLGNWGHKHRSNFIQELDEKSDFVVITNADNYHVPVFLDKMISGFDSDNIAATYCDGMVHSYVGWKVIPCRMALGYVDCAGVMIRSKIAKLVGWNDTESHSSDWTFFNDIIKKYGINSFKKVAGTLLVHN